MESSRASTALAKADGLARAHALDGKDHAVVAMVGDGALTGGMAWEAASRWTASGPRRTHHAAEVVVSHLASRTRQTEAAR